MDDLDDEVLNDNREGFRGGKGGDLIFERGGSGGFRDESEAEDDEDVEPVPLLTIGDVGLSWGDDNSLK